MDGNLKFATIDDPAVLFVPAERVVQPTDLSEAYIQADDGSKRLLDFAGSAALILATFPLLGLIAAAIKLSGPGAVIFEQPRVGKDGKVFKCYKFRTMVADAETVLTRVLDENPEMRAEWESSQKLTKDPRITRLGAFLRKTSMDELPQLFNVLKGEMSLVGPRPVVQSEMERYGRAARWYISCRPGMTGLWQVKRCSGTSYKRRVAFDIYYAKNRTMLLDIGLLLRTFPAVIQKDSP